MAKNKNKNRSTRGKIPLPKKRQEEKPAGLSSWHIALRETLESLAIAFMLAFFIRTFVVEAFVIPTGSMSPSLQGAHKDLRCPQCDQRFRVNASVGEGTPNSKIAQQCIAGMCPTCRYTVTFDSKATAGAPEALMERRKVPSYMGDRIIVNKFLYSFTEPERWDVIVFKYPGNATDNYIKRLVGLPEETIRIYQGDLFVGPEEAKEGDFSIERKPAKTVFAMRQLVHDTDHDSALLHEAGWPLRWQADDGVAAWTTEAKASGNRLDERFVATGKGDGEQWLRYRHHPPSNHVWPAIEESETIEVESPRLIGDFNPYNTRVNYASYDPNYDRISQRNYLAVSPFDQGIHWVGDLLLEADVEVEEGAGELILQLTEAGHRFRCRCDIASGKVTLEILPYGSDKPADQFSASASIALKGKGIHRLLFANVDDTLHLWVDDKLVNFDTPTTYNWKSLFGPREESIPKTSDDDPGDLAPAAVATRGASLTIDRLRVWRDIYYIAASRQTVSNDGKHLVTDYPSFPPSNILQNPDQWSLIKRRHPEEFPLEKDQFFVMGDNSPYSQDARLWNVRGRGGGKPGGNYLERHLLIGRAISVVWPHTWSYFPGFSDMRRIE